jgi:hypothetical protein
VNIKKKTRKIASHNQKSSASISWVQTKVTIKTFVSIRRLLRQPLSFTAEKKVQSPQKKFLFLVSPSKKNRMRFIQFRLLNDLTKVTRVGLQKTNGKIVDLSKALPSSRSLIDALTKLGSKGLVDRATQK